MQWAQGVRRERLERDLREILEGETGGRNLREGDLRERLEGETRGETGGRDGRREWMEKLEGGRDWREDSTDLQTASRLRWVLYSTKGILFGGGFLVVNQQNFVRTTGSGFL